MRSSVGGVIVWLVLGAGLQTILRPSAEQLRGLQSMLPQAPEERFLWIVFAFSAAICEEVDLAFGDAGPHRKSRELINA
jgi:hypothetical protein